MPETHFNDWIAERYEVLGPELFDRAVVDPAVAFLARLAGAGPALELGIGTGRIALPLSRRGLRVHGIEASPAMVAHGASTATAGGDHAPAYRDSDPCWLRGVSGATQIAISHHHWVIDGRLEMMGAATLRLAL
jgi:methylase of polypeptide subunit release factors